MKKENLIIQKVVAMLVIFVMSMAQFAIIGTTAITYAIDMFATNQDNVQFKAYFKVGNEETLELEKGINAEDVKLNIDVAVKNEGYFNGQISLENAGFKLKEDAKNEYISKIENNVIYLNTINAEETANIQVGIEFFKETEITVQSLNSMTAVKLTGTYYNSKRDTQIEGTCEVNVKWRMPEETKAEMAAIALTNSTYKVGEESKKIVQLLVSSKISNNSYPIKNTTMELDIPEGGTVKEVHKRTTIATNGNKEFSENNYNIENNKLTISVDNTPENDRISWQRAGQDIYVITYEFAKDADLSHSNIKLNGKITTYEERELNTEEKTINLNEEKDGIASIDTKPGESSIYKGKIYTGEEREIKTYTRIYVDYTAGIKELNVKENNSVYINNEDNSENSANIECKKITINKDNVAQVLGQEWSVTVKDSLNNKFTVTDKSEFDENGNTEVQLEDGVTSYVITTSKPQKEGIITIETTKVIAEKNYDRETINKFSKIKNTSELEYTKNDESKNTADKTNTIELKETETKASIGIDKSSLSTDGEQEVNLSILLDTNNETRDLYKNSKMNIVLPAEVKSTSARVKLLYGNGLEIDQDSFKIEEENGKKVIKLNLSGEQKSYSGEAVDGTTIIVNAKLNIESEKDTESEIVLNYTNDNAQKYSDNGQEKVKIDIVAQKTEQQQTQQQPQEQQQTQEQQTQQQPQEQQQTQQQPQEQQQTQEQQPQQQTAVTNNTKALKRQLTSIASVNNGEEINGELDVTAYVGGNEIQENAEVHAGEIIKYIVKFTNKGDSTIEGLKLSSTVPENTKMIILNPEYNTGTGDSVEVMPEYLITNNDTKVEKDNISLEAGKSYQYEYMVRVNTDLAQDSTTKAETSVIYQDNEIKKTEFPNQLIKSSIYAVLSPEQRVEADSIVARKPQIYDLYIYNTGDTEQRNIEVTLNKNELIEIKGLACYTETGVYGFNEESESFIIESIPAKSTADVAITALIKLDTDTVKNANMSATVKDSLGNIYRSNILSDKVEGIKLEADLKSEVKEDSGYLAPGADVKYTITVKNIGELEAKDLIIRDRFSDYLDLKTIKLNGNECEYTQQSEFVEEVNYGLLIVNSNLKAGEELKIEINATVKEDLSTSELLRIINKALIYDNEYTLLTETEEKEYLLQATTEDEINYEDEYKQNEEDDKKQNEEDDKKQDDGDDKKQDDGDDKKQDDGDDKKDDQKTEEPKFVISGLVWKDANNNGSRDTNEELLNGTKVYAINTSNNQIAKDSNNVEITATTNEKGEYTLANIPKGKYIVGFEYDTQKFKPTKYQLEGVNSSKNSDAVKVTKTINGEKKTIAATNSIDLTENKSNIDLGLVEVKSFNLELEKVISKVTVTNKSGTKTYDFEDTKLAKVEIRSKYLSGSNVVIEYKMKIKNTGEVAGYAKNIVDYMPSSLNFVSNLNNGWYKKGKYIYNETLKDTIIKPGETKEVELILTKTMTKSNTGLTNNKAEISKYYNEQGIENNAKEAKSADILITVSTGEAISYIAIGVIVIIAVCGVVYITKKNK